VYVLAGREGFFKGELLALIKRHCLDDPDSPACHELRPGEGTELSLPALLDELRAMSLFAPRKMVVVRQADRFVRDNDAGLAGYLGAPAPHAFLVLDVEALLARSKLAAAVKKGGVLLDCRKLYENAPPWKPDRPEESELVHWLRQRAAAGNLRLDPRAALRLTELTGNSPGALDNELEKLRLHGTGRTITAEDVLTVCAPGHVRKVYALVDAVTRGDRAGAFSALADALQWGLERGPGGRVERRATGIAPMVIGQFHRFLRNVWSCKRMLADGHSVREVAAAQGETRFPRRYEAMVAYAQRAPFDALRRRFRALLEADRAFKRSAQPPEALLTGIVAVFLGN
jgi:DNA polymerase-3 subunit delta